MERGRLPDEFVTVTGRSRKYAIGLLGSLPHGPSKRRGRPSAFGPEVRRQLVALWRAMDYSWPVRLKAMLPLWLEHGRGVVEDAQIAAELLRMSARTIDRILRSERQRDLRGRCSRRQLLGEVTN